MLTVDARCGCSLCEGRTTDMYRMVGHCSNCGAKPILILNRSGDKAAPVDCPTCGAYDRVTQDRLATPDEIPAVAALDDPPGSRDREEP